ncbi:MAG: DUF481 domain-containing protein [Photobacterium aquimaris]|nr:DUF481 domain-containing protein [Photobacterium aquimaris]
MSMNSAASLKHTTIDWSNKLKFTYLRNEYNHNQFETYRHEYIIANAFLNAEKKITSTLTVGANSGIDYGVSNTNYSIDGYIKNKLIGDISLLLDSQYIYNTEVSSDKSHSEIYSTVSLTYDF